MGKSITVGEGHTTSIKTDHRNGNQSEIENKVEVRPVIDGFHNETVKDRYRFKREFISMFVEDLFDLVVDGNMSLREWRVFLFLCATLNTKNIAVTKLDAIAKELKMDIPAVSTTISKLKKRKLVVEQKWICSESGHGSRTKVFRLSIGQVFEYLNPNIVYNGQIKDYCKIRGQFPTITLPDGTTLLNRHAEARRKQLIREQQQRESLFPDFYNEAPDYPDADFDADADEPHPTIMDCDGRLVDTVTGEYVD